MPGVPSGRGCEACRKQKKKCDEVQPSCSRCSRLEIACIGCGQRRYKFVDKQLVAAVPRSRAGTAFQTLQFNVPNIPFSPSNELTMATGAFCSAIGITDVRYDLSVYGGFLKDIPMRLGSNAALDASVNTFTTAVASLNSQQQSLGVLANYIKALKALRECLNDPAEANSANTMCAIYLIMISQSWIGNEYCAGHGEALAHLLNIAASRRCQDSFETELVMSACMLVIFESVVNPRVQLGPWLEMLTKARDNGVLTESLKLRNLARLPDFIKCPEAHLEEIKTSYQRNGDGIPMIRQLLSGSSPQSGLTGTLRCRYQSVYGLVLTYSTMLNTILRCFEVDNMSLIEESATFVQEIVTLADDAMQYRPFGSSLMPLCVIAAWTATNETNKRARLEEILAMYQSDFAFSRWMEIAYWLEKELKKHSGTRPTLLDLPLEYPYDFFSF